MKIGQATDYSVASKLPTASSPSDSAKLDHETRALAAATPSAAGVAVTVSKEARAMKQVHRSDAPEIDMAKVNAVRTAIEQGTYVVNPAAIADKLLTNAQEMLEKTVR